VERPQQGFCHKGDRIYVVEFVDGSVRRYTSLEDANLDSVNWAALADDDYGYNDAIGEEID